MQERIEENRHTTRIVNLYNLDVIIQVGYRIKSPLTSIFKDWCLDILNKKNEIDSINNYEIVPYIFKSNDEEITIEVKVSPEEDTVWLTQDQMADLFGTTRQNITMHVKNIYDEEELERWATCKEILQVQKTTNKFFLSVQLYKLNSSH